MSLIILTLTLPDVTHLRAARKKKKNLRRKLWWQNHHQHHHQTSSTWETREPKETSSTWETKEPKSDAPGIRYFTFQGFGYCQPSDGYEKQFVSKPGTPQSCAKHCENNDNQYGKSLAGIEYYKAKPSWGRYDDTCNCLMDVNYETGGITSVEEDSMGETLCYSNNSYMEVRLLNMRTLYTHCEYGKKHA